MTNLSVSRDELLSKIGRYVGWGDPVGWDAQQSADVDSVIVDGLRRFYFPADGYAWSFLTRSLEIPIVAGTYWYPLPADFCRITAGVTITGQPRPLSLTTESTLRQFMSRPVNQLLARYYAIRSSASNVTGSTAWEIGFWPVPDASCTANTYYLFDPGPVTGINLNPLGGSVHADTIIYSCLAAFDERFNAEASPQGSQKRAEFMLRLSASIAHDKMIGGM